MVLQRENSPFVPIAGELYCGLVVEARLFLIVCLAPLVPMPSEKQIFCIIRTFMIFLIFN